MHPPTQQQGVMGNHRHHLDEKLWGAKVRPILGILQIICGSIECVLGVVVIFFSGPFYSDRPDYIGWGIWNGTFAIVTGFLGVFSSRKKCMVIAYIITSEIAAVASAGCFTYAVVGALYASFPNRQEQGNEAMYSIMCIIFFTQMLISIVGASCTCGASFSSPNQPQQDVFHISQPCAPPYNLATHC